MNSLRLTCPRCGKSLRLHDPRMLGRRGKCPACAHRFLLEPDGAAHHGRHPPQPESSPLEPAETSASGSDSATASSGAAPPADDAAPEYPVLIDLGDDDPLLARWKRGKRRTRRQRRGGLITVCLLAAAGLFWVFSRQHTSPARNAEKSSSSSSRDARHAAPNDGPQAGLPVMPLTTPTIESSRRKPVQLVLMPAGARIVIHFHPSLIWSPNERSRELRECLGPLAVWAETLIHEHCLFEPAAIEEVTLGLLLDSPTARPACCAVVCLQDGIKRSELLQRLEAQRVDEWDVPIYVSGERAYVIHDEKTFAVAPRRLASEMVAARDVPGVTDAGIEAVLAETDRRRHLTVVLRPDDAVRNSNALVPGNVGDLFRQTMAWFRPDDVECLAWSLHIDGESVVTPGAVNAATTVPGDDASEPGSSAVGGGNQQPPNAKVISEIVLRGRPGHESGDAARQVRRDLDVFPTEMLTRVSAMKPQTQGRRRLIGRFPAMLQAAALSTTATVHDRLVRLTTVLPERAAPNLVLAARLTWEESSRAELSRAGQESPPR